MVLKRDKSDEKIKSQLSEIFTEKPKTAVQPKVEDVEEVETPKKTRDLGDTLNVYLPKGSRNELKKFCAEYGVSMSLFALYAIDYLQDDIKSGKATVSKIGIKRVE